ncbi:MAG: protein kinase [Myxococcota bacterium]
MTGYHGTRMRLREGQLVQSWEIEAEIGRGAMATVYRARHRVLGTLAAIKVLDRTDPTTEARLVAEGRAQSAVDHPGIVDVVDHLRIDEHAALVLEYVDGGDLRALLDRGPLPLDQALALFREIVAAVSAAHAAGLVHRDLKPSNVLLARRGDAWSAHVGDFGLVKSLDHDLTATHAMVGTPRSMAPEQMRAAARVDARADVFALGCLLYELATGRAPFTGDDLVHLYTAKLGGHYADPARVVPGLPAGVLAAIAGALQGAGGEIPSCEVLLDVLDGGGWTPPADETVDTGRLVLCPAAAPPRRRRPARRAARRPRSVGAGSSWSRCRAARRRRCGAPSTCATAAPSSRGPSSTATRWPSGGSAGAPTSPPRSSTPASSAPGAPPSRSTGGGGRSATTSPGSRSPPGPRAAASTRPRCGAWSPPSRRPSRGSRRASPRWSTAPSAPTTCSAPTTVGCCWSTSPARATPWATPRCRTSPAPRPSSGSARPPRPPTCTGSARSRCAC